MLSRMAKKWESIRDADDVAAHARSIGPALQAAAIFTAIAARSGMIASPRNGDARARIEPEALL